MKDWPAIFKRESAAYFDSPVAAIFLIIFAGLSGGLFMTPFFLVNQADMTPFFEILPWLLAVFLPAVTMRAWAEERRGNTLELLLTFPMSTFELVAGKFIAAVLFFAAALACTFMIPIMLFTLGSPDLGQIAAGYLGVFSLGTFFIAGGIFISGFCRDQIAAFVLSLVFCLGLYLLGQDLVTVTLDGWINGFGTWMRSAFGVLPHYAAFVRGVIDFRSVVFFGAGAFLLLLLNSFWMDNRSRRGAVTAFLGAAALCFGIFTALNGALSHVSLRGDLTQGKIYTVSTASKKILNKLQSQALIRLYISPRDKMPSAYKTLERELTGKLDELKLASGGKIKYEVVHMEASNALDSQEAEKTAEGQVTKKGVYPFQVQSIESDQAEVKLIYAAMTISYLEKPEDIIPQIYPADMAELEYRLVSKLYKMTFEKYPKVALVAPFEEKSMNPETAAILAQLTGGKIPEISREDNYEVLERIFYYEGYPFERINLTEKQPLTDEYSALFLVEPHALTARQKYEINRFLRAGGPVFMAVQNYTYGYVPDLGLLEITPQFVGPNVNDLLAFWGLAVSEQVLLDENSESVSVSDGGLFNAPIPVKLPLQIVVPPQGLNSKVPMVADLGSLFYLWGSVVEKKADAPAKLKYTTLFSSGNESREIAKPQTTAWTPADLKAAAPLRKGPFTLAVMAEGEFPDAFAGKPVPAWDEEGKEGRPETIAAKPSKLIVIGASSMFQNNLIKGGGHYRLIMNLLDALTFGEDLADVRAKRITDRTMPKISRAEKVVWRILATFLVPFILLMLGVYRFFKTANQKQKYLKSLTA